MKWYEAQNLKSKLVSDYVQLFLINNSFGVYRPINLMYERMFHTDRHETEQNPKFKHVSDHLFNVGFQEIKSDYRHDVELDNSKYDIIFADLPINIKPSNSFIFNNKIKVDREINHLAKCLLKLNDEGSLFFLSSESIMWGIKQRKILDVIEHKGFYLNSIINCRDIWSSLTSLELFLCCFQKKKNEELFIGTLNEKNFELIFKNFINSQSSDINDGMWVKRDSFHSFNKLIFDEQIKNKGDYSGYPKTKIFDISKNISTVKSGSKFEISTDKNVIYIPKIGKSNVITDLEETKLKHHNLFEVELNKEKILKEYAMYFFNTDKGRLYRQACLTGNVIKYISLKDLKELVIFLPELLVQKKLVKASQNLKNLIEQLDQLKTNLAYNPKQINKISKEIKSFSSTLSSVSEEDTILDMINEGENKTVEFKKTFAFNFHTNNNRDDNLVKASIKNIVAFINSEGGTLLLGVNDEGEITGMQEEIEKHKSKDKFKLYFGEMVKRIGKLRNTHVDFKLIKINEKDILRVTCKKSEKTPCFYEGKEFYIRQNPKAQLLQGDELYDYTKKRF